MDTTEKAEQPANDDKIAWHPALELFGNLSF